MGMSAIPCLRIKGFMTGLDLKLLAEYSLPLDSRASSGLHPLIEGKG